MVERRTPKNEEIFVPTKNLLLFNSCPRNISELGPHLTKKAGSAPETPVLESLEQSFRPSGPQLYQKETPTQVLLCGICEIFRNTYFYRTPLVAAFE